MMGTDVHELQMTPNFFTFQSNASDATSFAADLRARNLRHGKRVEPTTGPSVCFVLRLVDGKKRMFKAGLKSTRILAFWSTDGRWRPCYEMVSRSSPHGDSV